MRYGANKKVPIVSQVEESIREMIEKKEYKPGMKLPTEFEFCQTLQVGRGTVREALRLLQAKGLVEIKPGRGAFVAENEPADANPVVWLVQNEKELRDSIEIRNALEPLAARKMAENGSGDAMHDLRRIHDDFLSAIENGDADRIAELDEGFHSLIVKEMRQPTAPGNKHASAPGDAHFPQQDLYRSAERAQRRCTAHAHP